VVQSEGKQIQDVLSGLQGQMQELEKERTEVATRVERSLLGKYERIRKQRGGLAVVSVVGMTCKGCQRNIPPQMANNLRTGSEIVTCPSCHRFIYFADAEAAAAPA
jgi:uncharacterized protein